MKTLVRPPRRFPAGFTLIEVLISVAILALVVAGISTVLMQQSKATAQQTGVRDLEEKGRQALLELSRAIRLAGYGITPAAAFDFDRYACTTPGDPSTCNCNGASCGRNRADGPDELVVAWREPSFSRTATAMTGGGSAWTVTLSAPLTRAIQAGRIIQLLCQGAEPSTYMAVSSTTSDTAGTITLRDLAAADGWFPYAAPTDTCFNTAAVLLVERVRYHVANDTDGVPALFRDRGRGVDEVLFRGIEDLQFVYNMSSPPAGSPFGDAGTILADGGTTLPDGGVLRALPPMNCSTPSGRRWTYGDCISDAGAPPEDAGVPDWRNDPYDWPSRYNGHPANIRSVTITVVARAKQQNPDDPSGDAVPQLANRGPRARDRYNRAVFSLTEPTPNLTTRAHFWPLLNAGGTLPTDGGTLNVGGG